MSARGGPLGLRLFLEGVEVPVISASVSVQPDAPASAAIQIIPTDMGLHLLPRTLVHLFYLDPDSEEWAASDHYTTDQTNLNRFETSDYAYKIMFTGEVTALSYAKSPNGRQLILQCMDLSTYWDTCYQFFSDYSLNGSALTDKHHNFVAAGEGLFDNFRGTQWVISRLINTRPRSPEYQDTTGLLGGLIHLLEAVGGIRYRNSEFEGFRGVNDFFTIAELRYNLLGMLGAIADDKTSVKLYASKAFNAWLKNGMTSLGSLISFRDILNHLNSFIFHNIYPNPCAYYKAGGETVAKKRVKVGTFNLIDSTVGPRYSSQIKDVLDKLNIASDVFAELLFSTPVVRGSAEGTIRTSINLTAPGTRVTQLNRTLNECILILKNLVPEVESQTKASDSKKIVKELRTIRKDIVDAANELPTVPEGKEFNNFSRGSEGAKVKDRLETANTLVNGAADQIDDLLGKETSRFRTKEIKVPESSHLFNQLFLPQCFFVSPPRCNVIFPDQYYQLSYNRNFMREVSRMAMQGGIGMGAGVRGAKIFSKFYLAPNIRDVKGQILQMSLSRASRVILPHEVHSGIIPKMSWVTDGHRWGVKAASGKRRLKNVTDSQKIHYLQRLAEFQFYLHRWSARTLAIEGVFNPNIVAGFPAVVIDRSAPTPEVLRAIEKELGGKRMMPTQFVGKVHTYTHAIHQGGGSTSIQFAFARTHRGMDDEFMGIKTKEVKETSDTKTFEVDVRALIVGLDQAEDDAITYQMLTTTGASEQQASAFAKLMARKSKRLEKMKEVIRLYIEEKLKPRAWVKGVGKVRKVTTKGRDVLLTKSAASRFLGLSGSIFDDKAATESGSEFSSASGFTDDQEVQAVRVPEKVKFTYVTFKRTGKFERDTSALEDVVRPGWFAEDVWGNDNITEKVYAHLLGSMAITDDKGIGYDQQDEMLKRWEDQQRSEIRISPDEVQGATPTSTFVTGRTRGQGTVSVQSIDEKFIYTVVPGSVEETIDGISLVYGMIKERGDNVHEFIREFTQRPIASMIDVLGSQNLDFAADGKLVNEETMIEGFHSRAFGDYNADVRMPDREGSKPVAGKNAGKGLMSGVENPAGLARESIISKKRTKEPSFRPELDPRGRAQGRVVAYMQELKASRGLLSQ